MRILTGNAEFHEKYILMGKKCFYNYLKLIEKTGWGDPKRLRRNLSESGNTKGLKEISDSFGHCVSKI